MEINPIRPADLAGALAPSAVTGADAAQSAGSVSFKSLLGDALAQVNQLQQNADTASVRLAAGENVGIDEVMLAMQKAELALQLTSSIRNKLVEAYQDVTRMQI
ncbi:MAG: flagellar hook-basal body complex protein FliE [Candidatus Coatesbacteria bacterium]